MATRNGGTIPAPRTAGFSGRNKRDTSSTNEEGDLLNLDNIFSSSRAVVGRMEHSNEETCSSDTGTGLSSTHSPAPTNSSSSVYTASLIQSAANLLDDTSPSTVATVSDDESDGAREENDGFDNANDDGTNLFFSTEESKSLNNSVSGVNKMNGFSDSLQSLCVATIPAMPNEQDRKCFIGCLAAVLAASYDYDVADEEDHTEESREQYRAFLEKAEQLGSDVDDDSGNLNGLDEHQELADLDDEDSFTSDNDDDFDWQEDSFYQNYYIKEGSIAGVVIDKDTSIEMTSKRSERQTLLSSSSHDDEQLERRDKPEGQRQRQQQRQRRSDQQHQRSLKEKNNLSNTSNSLHRNRTTATKSTSNNYEKSEQGQDQQLLPALTNSSCSASFEIKESMSLFWTQEDSNSNNKDNNISTATGATTTETALACDLISAPILTAAKNASSEQGRDPKPKQQRLKSQFTKKCKIARNRHRRRRYELFSKFLVSAAELLFLDVGQAKAFLPMLAKLLVPPAESQKKSEPHKKIMQQQTLNFHDSSGNTSDFFIPAELDQAGCLRPFLESLSPGAGFRCLALLLIQHLLHSNDGYDARIRHALKKVAVLVLIRDMERDPIDSLGLDSNKQCSYRDWVERATRKFESLEHNIATRLIRLSQHVDDNHNQSPNDTSKSSAMSRAQNNNVTNGLGHAFNQTPRKLARERILRGIKIGSAGLVAGTLFAVTGGLAAPGILAGVAALAGGTVAATAAGVVLTSTVVVQTIFGVGGGSLAAYKMNRRTQGLTEFYFIKENNNPKNDSGSKASTRRTTNKQNAPQRENLELFSTICISGWLTDASDFQRPWGVHPKYASKVELLQRFYSIHNPEYVTRSQKILKRWKGEEKELWRLLKLKYGRDPDNLFPLSDGPRLRGLLTVEQEEALDQIFGQLGFYDPDIDKFKSKNSFNVDDIINSPNESSAPDGLKERWRRVVQHRENHQAGIDLLNDNLHSNPSFASGFESVPAASEPSRSSQGEAFDNGFGQEINQQTTEKELPKHLSTVWDYRSRYGGELYTVYWESGMLIELCDSVTDLAFDVVSGATTQILRTTVLSSLLSAVALPYAMVSAANMIDGTWTIAIERAEEAGKELARSLLFSKAGNRPVTLVGFSFGARVVYCCLKELAHYQEKWEALRERRNQANSKSSRGTNSLRRRRRRNDNTREKNKDNSKLSDDDAKLSNMREPASIVEDVILMGLPNHLSLLSWAACRQIVGGRLINCYSRKDLILSLMFQIKRLASAFKPVCGTCPVNVPGVENIDVTDLVQGHQDYCLVTGDILNNRVRHGQPFRGESLEMPSSLLLQSLPKPKQRRQNIKQQKQ